MNDSLREAATHGNRDFPFALYHMHRIRHTYSVPLHWHDEVELIYIEKGTLYLSIDRRAYTGTAGDIFMVNSWEIHDMYVTETSVVYSTALFPLTSLLFRQEDEVEEKYLRPLADGRLRFPTEVSGLPIAPTIREKAKQLITLFSEAKGCYKLQIRVLLLSIITDFFTSGSLVSDWESQFQDKHRRILGFINENYHRELTLESVAAEFHMVPKYFSRYFKNAFHQTFTEYVNRLRMEKAADQLRHTDLSVTEIAIRTGFNSSSYFNKQFRAAYGKTPSRYRRDGE